MRILIATILIFTSPAQPRTQRHTREDIPGGFIDTVQLEHGTYIDVRYDDNPDGMGVTMLGCKVKGVACDSPAMFKRLVSERK